MKTALYAAICVLFLAAGGLDLADRQWKPGVVSILFAIVNGVIFLWR